MLDELDGVGPVSCRTEREDADRVSVGVDLYISDTPTNREHEPDDVGGGRYPVEWRYGGGGVGVGAVSGEFAAWK